MRAVLLFCLVACVADAQSRVYRSRELRGRFGRAGPSGVACTSTTTACTPGEKNALFRSEDFTHAAWTAGSAGVAVPAITPNTGIGANCSSATADTIVFPATGAADQSVVYQNFPSPGGQDTCSIYLEPLSGAGTIDVCVFNGSWLCSACALAANAYTRCAVLDKLSVSYFLFGLDGVRNGGAARAALTVRAWGAQCEINATPTGYIPTAAAEVTCS